MSSSSMCQTVYDTVHTVVYDTVHTVSFDTVRTFDTVKVMLDSNYSVQILHDAQQFYADSFNSLLAVVSVSVNGLCSLLNKIGSAADDELLAFAVSSVLPEIENNFEKMGFCKGYDQLALWVEEEISRFSSSITELSLSDDSKHAAIEYINKIDSKIKQKLSEFNKINRGEDPVCSGRFYTAPKNRPDTKSRKK